jgi:hypothetical protein
MGQCETCGNKTIKPLISFLGGQNHTFDSFECAIHKLAPTGAHCSWRILGHGVEAGGAIYCCADCAEESECTRSEIALKLSSGFFAIHASINRCEPNKVSLHAG